MQAATIYLTKQYEDPNTPGPQQGTVFLWASLVPADLLAVEAAPQRRFWWLGLRALSTGSHFFIPVFQLMQLSRDFPTAI